MYSLLPAADTHGNARILVVHNRTLQEDPQLRVAKLLKSDTVIKRLSKDNQTNETPIRYKPSKHRAFSSSMLLIINKVSQTLSIINKSQFSPDPGKDQRPYNDRPG